MRYKVIKRLNKNQINDLYKLYKNEWWTKDREKKDIKKMLKYTPIIIGVVKDKKLIAFARVLSDFTYKAEIYDIIVRKKYRNKGVGKLLIKEILNHKKLKNVKQFNLQCEDKMVLFYKKFGFKSVDSLIYMRYLKTDIIQKR